MKKENSSKRDIIQWIAFVVVMVTIMIRIALYLSGVARNLEYYTINAITWTGITIGIALLCISYLIQHETMKK